MMSLMDQQWCPTSVQVTALQARGLRIKGKSGTNDAYAVMQVGREKYQTSVAEKCVAPVWKEEAAFDLPPPSPSGGGERGTLHVQVMHRALVGPDKLLGQAVVSLLQLSEDSTRSKTEWFKLLDKTGKADKDRGEVLLDIQFMRNNMTASMFDLSAAGKSRSRLSKLKDKVRGKKKETDSMSSVVPSFTQVLTDSEEEANGHGEETAEKDEKKKKHKKKSLFSPKSNLQKNMSQSMSVLPASSTPGGSQSPGLNMEASEGKKKFKFMIHKRSGSSDNKDSFSGLPKHSTVEQSNLCINGSHVYCEEPQARTSRGGSNFSLTSSGHGSMEDVPERQYSPCTEEDEETASVDNTEEIVEKRMRVEEERLRKHEDEIEKLAEVKKRQEEEKNTWEEERKRREEDERVKREEEKEKRRLEEEEKRFAEEKVRKEEEERKRREEEKAEEERRRQKEEERVRKEQERRQKEEERATKEKEENERLVQEKLKLEEEKKRVEAEWKIRLEEEQKVRLEEERRRKEEELEKIRRENEKKRLEQEERRRTEEEEKRQREQERIIEEETRRKEEEERAKKEEYERLAEEIRKQEEHERIQKEQQERIRKAEERMRMEEKRREEERARKEIEEMKRLAEEKRRQEEQERMHEDERIRKEEEERIRKEEERRRQEEEERVRKEREEMKRLAEEKRRQEEQENMKIEEEVKTEKKTERKRKEDETRKLEKDELITDAEEQNQTENKSEDGLKSKVSMGSPTKVTSSNVFGDSYNPFEENPNSSFGPDRNTAKVSNIHQGCQSAVASVELKSTSTDEKDLISVQREKRPAPQPPGRNQAETLCQKDTDVAARHLAQANKQSKDKDIKTASVLPQRSVQLIMPVSRSPIDTKSTPSSMQSGGNKGATSAAIHSKRPAPPRPASVDEEPPSTRKTTSPSGSDVSAGGSEAKQCHSVYGFNPFEDDEEDDEEQDDLTTSGDTRSICWPPAVSPAGSQTKIRSSKVARAPPPPADITTVSTSGTQACDPGSEAKTSPVQETQAVAQNTEEGAGVRKHVPPTASRRLQPVKPLNPLEQQSVLVVQGENDNKSTGILSGVQNKMKSQVNDGGLKGPYSQLTRDELISLVLKQEKQLSEKNCKISELEQYIDGLLVRVMEEKPSILMSMNSLNKAA